MSSPSLIGIDWGISSRRAWLIADGGCVIDARRDGLGIAKSSAGDFDSSLDDLIGGWPDLPVVMCGMVGGRGGWFETPYVKCPAGPDEIAAVLVPVISRPRTYVVPGLSVEDEWCDVLRGEETQVIGLFARAGPDALVVLPGSHSKWVSVSDGKINAFRTFPTGELFEVILEHTVVGALAVGGEISDRGFGRGLDLTDRGDGLLANLFSVRSELLLGRESAADCAGHLSGLLIGAEVREGLALFGPQRHCHVIGSPLVIGWYAATFERAGVEAELVDEDIAAGGLWRIGSLAGMGS